MKLWGIFRFELAYQIRRVWPWAFLVILMVLSFLMTRDGSLSEALFDDFFVNSPFAIAKTTVFGSLMWLLLAAAIAGEAGARDVATGMHPLTFTSPISKSEYLGGRFFAALVINLALLLGVQVAILTAIYLPGIDSALIGPFRIAAYLTNYGFLAFPTAFVGTALQFSFAVRSGRPMSAYLGSLLLIFMGVFVAGLLTWHMDVGKLLDPFGIRFVIDDLSHEWTTVEKNSRLLDLVGLVLWNRILWVTVGLGALAVTYARFQFAHRTQSTRWWKRWTRRTDANAPEPSLAGVALRSAVSVPRVERSFNFALHLRQTLAIASASFRYLAKSWAGLALFAGIPVMTIIVVIDQMSAGGSPLTPTTARVLRELTAPISAELSRWVIIPMLIIFFAGELVWREREAGLGEINDTIPGSEWITVLGKLLGLGLVVAVFIATQIVAGVAAQAMMGYHDFQLGLYAKTMFGLQLPEYLLFVPLALVIHVIVNQKYIAHLVAVTAYVFIAVSSLFGIEHNMLIFGASPGWMYTPMRGFGSSIAPWLWFKLYWAGWAMAFVVATALLWVRSRDAGFKFRMSLARRRFTRSMVFTAATAVGLVLTLGGFVFYNTNVLNTYRSPSEIDARSADYERLYGRYELAAQPRIATAGLRIEIYPDRRALDVLGTYNLENRNSVAIDSLHLVTNPNVETSEIALDRPATLVVNDDDLGYRIYALQKPLQPGDSLKLSFRARVEPHGFRESGANQSVVENGTFFSNSWFPAIGYQSSRQLINPADRRKYGLTPRPMIPSLYDAAARKQHVSGPVLDVVIGTSGDQVAVAPGSLLRSWTEKGRRYFHYSTEGPVEDTWEFLSAKYAMNQAQWTNPDGSGKNVTIQIFHHPSHTAYIEPMLRSIKASLDYYTKEFGAYDYSHINVAEQPGDGTGLHAEAGMITHSEGFALWKPAEDEKSLDMPYAVVAHEMGHEFTAPYAFAEGAPVMSESLAWYYAIELVDHMRGPDQKRKLLSFMHQPYPIEPIHRGEPLLRGLDPYMSYRKGPFALYALREYVGEDKVNGALRSLREKHRAENATLVTTLDLYHELQAVTPDSLRYLLHDLFEVNTFWQLEAEKVSAVEKGGVWQLTLDVRAKKIVADTAGVETEVPMNEWIPVGVFGASNGGGELSAPLYLKMHRIRSGSQTISITVPGKPVLAGIDPFHVLDVEEREDDDNVERVRILN